MEGWVTCYADAGWEPRTRVGTWAYMIRSADGWYKKSGICPEWVNCSSTAEMAAVIAGVYRALRVWPGVKGVGVRTDSQAAIHYLQFRPYLKQFNRRDWVPIRRMLHGVLNDYDCRIRFVHVKGHRPRHESNAARLNGNVDKLATMARAGRFVDESHETVQQRAREVADEFFDYFDLLEPPH